MNSRLYLFSKKKLTSDKTNHSLSDEYVIIHHFITPDNQCSEQICSGNVIFVSENADQLCDGLLLRIQEKLGGDNSNGYHDEIVATVDKLIKYNCIDATQHKKVH